MTVRPPDDDPAGTLALIRRLTATRRTATLSEAARLRRQFAHHVLPRQPTARILAKHGQHVEDDGQWPTDASPDGYLASLRATILNPNGGIYLVEAAAERTWTIYFVGSVPYQWRGPYPGRRIVVLFNAERLFWITGFQAEAGDAYVDRQSGFWAYRPR